MNNDVIANYIQIGLLIITFASVFSPVIVTILNNLHDTKIRKLELNSKTKQDVLNQFSKSVIKEFNSNFINHDFRNALNMLYVYFDVDDKLIENITSGKHKNVNEFQNDVTKLMKKLSKQIEYK